MLTIQPPPKDNPLLLTILIVIFIIGAAFSYVAFCLHPTPIPDEDARSVPSRQTPPE